MERLTTAGHPDAAVEILVSALRSEVEAYRVNGRSNGGLGTLAFTHGGRTYNGIPTMWRTVGAPSPRLIAPDPQTTRITSHNADSIVHLFASAYNSDRGRFAELLCSFLDRDGEFATVGYLLVYSAQQVGLLRQAFDTAWDRLRGDRAYGFSEVLRMLSGLVRFSHHALSIEDLRRVETLTATFDDDNFQLPVLIAEARLANQQPACPSP
jgi:hypothetical protein